ncbi:MAG: hypothetical protein ACE5JV_00075, partial [Nitrososphaerales archaeon]
MNVNKYFMILAIGTGMIAIGLLVFHIPILALRPLLIIAVALIGVWAYYYWREDKKKQQTKIQAEVEGQKCWCHICKHTEATDCVKTSC